MKSLYYILVTISLLIAGVVIQSVRLNNLTKDYNVSIANNKAYEAQLDVFQEENMVFQFTIEQLEYISDTTIRKLDSVRKELKIKDKKIQQMSKIKEKVYIVDTLRINDTIFKEPDFILDTCLGDKWYQDCLHLAYPNIVNSEIRVNTETDCFIHTSRETVNPPCKTWIGRLFQKKHTVINVTVYENNPYSKVKECKFVKIIDK